MSNEKEIIKKIYDRFHNDAAGFSTAFTNIFREQDGSPQAIYPLQLEVLNKTLPHEKLVAIVKTRQCGISTSVKALALHRAYFGKVPNILVCSASQMQATKLLREIKEAVDSMPEFLRPEFTKETETEIHFKSGSKIISLPQNPATVRGYSADVILDEYALLNRKDSEALFEALFPSLLKGWQMTVISTPRGKDNLFYDLCNPKTDEDGKVIGIRANKVIRIHWTDVPHVKAAVERDKLYENMPPKSFLQEFCCEFVSAESEGFFSFEFLREKFIDEGMECYNTSNLDMLQGDSCPSELILRDLNKRFRTGIFCGFDGALSGDNSVFTVWGVNGEEWQHLAIRKLPKGMGYKQQTEWVSRACHMFGARKLGYDDTAGIGKAFGESFRETRISNILYPFIFTSQSKMEEYSKLKLRIDNHHMKSFKHDEMVQELSNLGLNPITGRIAAMGSKHSTDDFPSAILCAHAARNKINTSGFSLL